MSRQDFTQIPGVANRVRPYRKEDETSYSLGGFPTLELLESRPQAVRWVILHSSCPDTERIRDLCRRHGIPYAVDDRTLDRISEKGNCFTAAVFSKYACALDGSRPHVVLVHPGDMGNLGTIIRTLIGFGIYDLGIITPGADIFHPKTVRASMGALFKLRFEQFFSFDAYRQRFESHEIFPFMTGGNNTLSINEQKHSSMYTLVFGNESTGLDPSFARIGTCVRIPQTEDVDSLNLPVAVGIGVFAFALGNQ